MAKKLRKGLGEDTHIIKRGKFEMETAKMYIVFAIIVFHIVPLIFVFMGTTGVAVMMNMFLYTFNIIFLAGVCIFYGIRIGFNFKFPIVISVIAILSYLFYYYNSEIWEDVNYVMTGVIFTIVYALFSFGATVVGGWLKRFF